jgi:pimeloyl-ACP methyl ester carboxylesterase
MTGAPPSGGVMKAPPGMEFDADQVVRFLGSSYGEVSPDGQEHFPDVVAKIGEMMTTEPHLDVSDLAKVTARSLVRFADDDVMPLSHAVQMFDALPDAEFAVVPRTSHFLTQEKPHLVNAIVLDFLTNEPVPLVAPIRRAPRDG